MSWSFSQTGPVEEVRDAFKATFATNPVGKPEESIRNKVAGILDSIKSGYGPDWHCEFSASGSQSVVGEEVVNSTLNVSIMPVPAA